MAARNGKIISGNGRIMNFDAAVRTFASSLPEQGLHYFAFNRGWFNAPSILGRKAGVLFRNECASNRRKIISAVKAVGGETDPIGIPRNKVSGMWNQITTTSDLVINRTGAGVKLSDYIESFEKQYTADHKHNSFLLSQNMIKNIAANPGQAAVFLSDEARYICAAFIYVQACFRLAELLVDFLDQQIARPEFTEVIKLVEAVKVILGDLDPDGQQALVDFEQRLTGLAELRKETVALSGNSKAIVWFCSGLVTASVAMAVFFFFARQPPGEQSEKITSQDIKAESAENSFSEPGVQTQGSGNPDTADQLVDTKRPVNYVENNIKIPSTDELTRYAISERIFFHSGDRIEIPLLAGTRPLQKTIRQDDTAPVNNEINSVFPEWESGQDKELKEGLAGLSISISPQKKKKRLIEVEHFAAETSQGKNSTDEGSGEPLVSEVVSAEDDEMDALQYQTSVYQTSSHSEPAQESTPEKKLRFNVANVLASMDGQDAVLLNNVFETVRSNTFYAWDNRISRYTFEIVLEPAYTDLHGRICRPGSITAWIEPQTLITVYQQQRVRGCRTEYARWFVE